MACLGCTKLLGDLSMPKFSCAESADNSFLTMQSCEENKSTQFERCPDATAAQASVFNWNCCPAQESRHGTWLCCAWRGSALAPERPWLSQKHTGIRGSCLCYLGTFILYNTVRSCGYSCGCLRVPHICVTVFQQ